MENIKRRRINKEKVEYYINLGYNYRQIAEATNHNEEGIRFFVKRNGLCLKKKEAIKKKYEEYIKNNLTLNEIAKELNVSRGQAARLFKIYNVKNPEQIKKENEDNILKEKILEFIRGDLQNKEILKLLNISAKKLIRLLKELDIKTDRPWHGRIDKLNQKFGKLLVIECLVPSLGHNQNKGGLWKCQCDCGNIIEIVGRNLNDGSDAKKSCGCLKLESSKRNGYKNREYREATINAQYSSHFHGATGRNLSPLSRKDWESIVFKPCYYCGKIYKRNVNRTKSKNKNFSEEELLKYDVEINGIDRKDSNKDYNLDDCVPCCSMCNWMKMDYTMEEFIEKIKDITINLNLFNFVKNEEELTA